MIRAIARTGSGSQNAATASISSSAGIASTSSSTTASTQGPSSVMRFAVNAGWTSFRWRVCPGGSSKMIGVCRSTSLSMCCMFDEKVRWSVAAARQSA